MPTFDVLSPEYTEVKVTLAGDVNKGDFVVVGTQTDGFYMVDGLNGEEATVITKARKVKTIAKNTGEAWVAGNALYWDSGNSWVTTTVAANSLIGYAIEIAASAATIGYLAFDGASRFLKA